MTTNVRSILGGAVMLCFLAAGAAAERPHSTYLVTDRGGVPALPSAVDHAAPTIIYMNKSGGTYYPGDNDARTNRSSIPSATSRIDPWTVSAAGWQQIMTCIRDEFSRFNVTITDADPGNVPHLESVVAGSPGDVGMGQGVGGVSPFTDDCAVIPNSIVFTFAEVYGTDYRAICETAAQEISHSFGLDHEYLCKDPMTYLGNCGDKTFQDMAPRCGEYSARNCACGNPTQNSVQMLLARVGRANTPPTVAITQPADNATVEPTFAIAVDASDSSTVAKVDLWIDGALAGTDNAAPWSFTAPALADGAHTLEARATDDAGATTAATIHVMVATPNGGGSGSGTGSGGGGGDDDDTSGNGGEISGGCATGSGPSGAVPLGLLAVAGLALSRRRR